MGRTGCIPPPARPSPRTYSSTLVPTLSRENPLNNFSCKSASGGAGTRGALLTFGAPSYRGLKTLEIQLHKTAVKNIFLEEIKYFNDKQKVFHVKLCKENLI